MKKSTPAPNSGKMTQKMGRTERLKQQLRANLKRRKSDSAERQAGAEDPVESPEKQVPDERQKR